MLSVCFPLGKTGNLTPSVLKTPDLERKTAGSATLGSAGLPKRTKPMTVSAIASGHWIDLRFSFEENLDRWIKSGCFLEKHLGM
jgi:hypothetical protein